MVQLKLGPLDGLIRPLSYALHNEANEKTGIFFQFYAFLWIVLTSFFIATRMLSINERPDPVYIASAPMYILTLYIPMYIFWIYENKIGIEKRRIKEMQIVDAVNAEYRFGRSVETGFKNPLFFRINNPTEKKIENIWLRTVFPETVICERPVLQLGSLEPVSSLCTSFSFIPLISNDLPMGYYDLYFEVNGHKHQKPPFFFENVKIDHSYLTLDVNVPERLRLGHSAEISIKMQNTANININELYVKCSFSNGLNYDTAFSEVQTMTPGASFHATYQIVPTTGEKVEIGSFEIFFKIANNVCKIGPITFDERYVDVPDVDVRIKIPDTLHSEVENSIGIYIDNISDEKIHNVCFNSCFSSFVECHEPTVCVSEILANSSAFTSIVVKPLNPGNIDLGNLNFSFEVNDIVCRKEPFDLGTHKVI